MNFLLCILVTIFFQTSLVASEKTYPLTKKRVRKATPFSRHPPSAQLDNKRGYDLAITQNPLALMRITCEPAHQTMPEETSQQFYDRLSDTDKQQFIDCVKQDPTLRAPRINNISDSVMELALYHNIAPHEAVELAIPIDQQGDSGKTLLMQLARGYWEEDMSEPKITQQLLALKADPTLQDDHGRNAFGYALSSDHAARQALLLAGHPKIAALINEPMLINARRQSCLSAVINASQAYSFYQAALVKTLLRAGAHVSLENVVDSANEIACCKPIFKKCSLNLLLQARPLIRENRSGGYPLLSRKRALNRGILYQLREAELKKIFPKDVYKIVKGCFEKNEKIDW